MAAILRICILILGVFFTNTLIGQPISFEYITSKDGLPQSTIRGIVKDKYGFMWFGTWNGLCRYDGYALKIYRTIPGDTASLASNRIHYLYKDQKGDIWISVFNQTVCRYNYLTDDFTRFKLTDLPQAFRDSVSRMRDLDVFEKSGDFLRRSIGPFHLSLTREHIVFETQVGRHGGLNDNNVNSIYRDDAGILWLGTGAGGINKADLNASKFQSVAVHRPGEERATRAVRSMWVDADGVWLGTEDDGLIFLDGVTQQQHYVSSQLRGENIKAVFKDRTGNIWLGKRSGLDKYDPRTKKIINYFNAETSPENSRFYAIAADPETDDIWFSYYNGVLRYDPQLDRFEKQAFPFYERSGAGCLFFDSKHNLWIGTEYAGVVQLKRDPKTKAWVDTVVYTSVASDARSPDERVYSIAEDSQGDIWVGAAKGLSRIHPQTEAIRTYTIKDGLTDQYVTSVMAQYPGYIWFAHKNGVSKFNIKTGQIQNYAVKKPGQDYEFMDGAGFRSQENGQIYYGTTQGFVYFNPSEIVDNPFLPNPTFTSLQVLNKTVHVGDTINGKVILETPIHMTRSIMLTHQDRSFSIEFSALHYSNPERNQYAYILEGQDKEWIHTDATRRFANYSNLAAGTYVLKVKASNSDGVWNPQPALLEIIVLPPWWRTWWAYLIYGLLLLAAAFGLFRIVQVRQQYHRQLLTERLKTEKAQELDQLKSSFFTNVSHEFRTPLTLIVDPLRSLLSKKDASEKDRAHYHVMYRNAQRLLALINQFLDFRKLESGKMQLQPQRQDLVAVVKNIASAFNFKADDQQIRYELRTSHEQIVMGFDVDVVGKILYNLISNAFKFTASGGTITVAVTAAHDSPQSAELVVADDGIGIASEKLDKIFDPFFQVEGAQQHAGTGVGLSLTRELVGLHQGSIEVFSEPGRGTSFNVKLRNLETNVISEMLPQQPEVEQTAAAPEALPDSKTEQPILLLVEDNEDIRAYIKQQLIESYAILDASNGVDGMAMALAHIPDLVISDIMMPGMNGLELCAKLKTDEKTSHIPVILLTARQSDQYEAEGYETGADAYVVKPFSMPLLEVRVKNLIENRVKLRALFSQSPESYANPVGLNAADKSFLAKATDLIEIHMADGEVNVEWLAHQLLMSRTQLYRKVKAIANQSVHEFVTGIRLNKAAELLLQGQHSVTEVAYLVGYADATSFTRMFQKQYRMTPKKYSLQEKTPN